MNVLLRFCRFVDGINDRFGALANWLVLLSCLISAANAFVRYGLNGLLSLAHSVPALRSIEDGVAWYGNNANSFLELQWYMFAGMVLLGAPYTFKVNEHVRVDLVYGMISDRARIWIDIVGTLLFLLPICIILVYFTWPWFMQSLAGCEHKFTWSTALQYLGGCENSSNAGGLVRWPVKLILPVGFALMVAQGVSELIKRFAALGGYYKLQYQYEKPLQ